VGVSAASASRGSNCSELLRCSEAHAALAIAGLCVAVVEVVSGSTFAAKQCTCACRIVPGVHGLQLCMCGLRSNAAGAGRRQRTCCKSITSMILQQAYTPFTTLLACVCFLMCCNRARSLHCSLQALTQPPRSA
jgi:hypothetical protein